MFNYFGSKQVGIITDENYVWYLYSFPGEGKIKI